MIKIINKLKKGKHSIKSLADSELLFKIARKFEKGLIMNFSCISTNNGPLKYG